MTSFNFDDDARRSFGNWLEGIRRNIRYGLEDELDPANARYIAGLTRDDLVFPGGDGLGDVAPEYVPAAVGFGFQTVRLDHKWMGFEVDLKGHWLTRKYTVDKRPEGLEIRKGPGGKKGLFDRDGNAVTEEFYIHGVRRWDPATYIVQIRSVEKQVFYDYVERLRRLRTPDGDKLPIWGSRWQWKIIKVEGGSQEGALYDKWDPAPLGVYGDSSFESPTDAEYAGARSIHYDEATEMPMSAFPEPPDPPVPDDDLEPPPPAPDDDPNAFEPDEHPGPDNDRFGRDGEDIPPVLRRRG
jgi:hypothetical protein